VSNERAKTALQLFEDALEVTPAERPSWVSQACGDDAALAADVRSLLAAHDSAGDFLESGPVAPSALVAADGPAELHIAAGATLGDFVIERQIGAGGMGLVYRARQISVNRPVALKILPPHLRYSASARTRFQREVEAAARLRHPNIVAVYTAGEDDGAVYFAMELIDGPALSDVIAELRRNPLPELMPCRMFSDSSIAPAANTRTLAGDVTPPPAGRGATLLDLQLVTSDQGYFVAVARLVADVADALDYAHRLHVVHRDVKPSNLLLSDDGQVHISDFGLARVAQEPGLTRTGDILGTPFYMAPEQISASAGVVDERTDVYALGATLFELLTLRPPFASDQRQQVLMRIVRDEPTPPRAINRLVPRDLDTICRKAIEKRPARRYQRAGDLAEDLRRFVVGRPILARRTTALDQTIRWVQRHRAMTAAVGAMCALAVAALFFAYRTYRSEARWTDAQFSRLFETAQMAALEGDLQRAGDAIDEAQRLGAPAPQMLMLHGQYDLQAGQFQDACDKLEAAAAQLPNSLAAHALLAIAYDANELHEKSAAQLQLLGTFQLVTLQDHLLLGRAQFQGDFDAAIQTLNRAVQLDKTSVQARMIRGGALVERAMDSGDAEHAERALDDLQIASELLEPNAYLLGNLLQAQLVAATAYQRVGDDARRQQRLDAAAQVAKALEAFPDQQSSQRWRAFYYDYIGDDQRAIDVWLSAKDRQIAYVVLALFRLGRGDEALKLCDERLARFPHARFTEFFRSVLLSATAETPAPVLAAFELRGPETLDPLNDHRFTYAVDCLAGNLAKAQAHSRAIRAALKGNSSPDVWRPELIAYTSGESDDDVLLSRTGASRIAACQAHYFIGLTRLAAGERAAARRHFQASADLRVFGFLETHISRALLAQLDREPTWPRWIPAR
jgi:serine/threonine protein kinase